jgi:hypothetical protein
MSESSVEACHFLKLLILLRFFGDFMKIWTVLLVAVLALTGVNAEAAKRLGGGKSIGKQSSNVSQREAAPAAPAAPSQGATNAAPKPAPAAAAAPKRPWGAMLGGLAAGLGLAWLAQFAGNGGRHGANSDVCHAGYGCGRWNWMVYAAQSRYGWCCCPGAPFAFQGAGNVPVSPTKPYRPENVGNDASAAPGSAAAWHLRRQQWRDRLHDRLRLGGIADLGHSCRF